MRPSPPAAASSMRTVTPSSGTAVVHAAAGGLAGAVGAHHGDTGRGGGLEHRPRRRAAAEQDGVEVGQGRGGRGVGQGLGQLVGHQRGVAPPGAQFARPPRAIRRGRIRRSRSSSTGTVPACRLRTSTWIPAMWCAGSASSQRAGSAEPVMGGRRAGDQRGRGQHRPLGGAGGSRRRDHQGDRRRRSPHRPATPLSAAHFHADRPDGIGTSGCVAAVQHALRARQQRQRAGRAGGGHRVRRACAADGIRRSARSR